MPGIIDKQLTQVTQTDGTAQTIGNSGWSSLQVGSGNTAIFADAAKMGAIAGYRMTCGGTAQNIAYLDLPSAVTVMALRVPLQISSITTVSAILRWYNDSSHATTLGSMGITSTGKIQFVEVAGSGTALNVSSSGSLSAATPYVLMILIDKGANTFSAAAYPQGSTTPAASISGTLGGAMKDAASLQQVRWAVGTATSLSYLDTNSDFAIGHGDWLARTDVTAPLDTPTVTLGTVTNPTTIGGSNGTAAVSWPAVSNATSYDAYLAAGSSPAQGDFTLVASGVTSPYTFTGLDAGAKAFGIKARP